MEGLAMEERDEIYGIIYKITNTINGKVYIGQTTRSFDKRYSYSGTGIERVYKYHKYWRDKGYDKTYYNDHLLKSIEKYGLNCWIVEREFDIVYNHNEAQQELDEKEIYWISYYNSNDYNFGYNKSEGGLGGNVKTFNNKGENHPMYGKHHTEEAKENMRKKLKGKNNYRAIKIICINDKKIYECIADASRETGILNASIEKNCKKQTKSAGRNENGEPLIWMKYEEYLNLSQEELEGIYKYIQDRAYKKIICLNDKRIFDNSNQAENFYKVPNVKKCCDGERKETKGLRFKYLKDYKEDIE